MANEITITLKLACTNGKYSNTFNPTSLQFNQAAIGAGSGIWNVGTSEENLVVPDGLANNGYFAAINTDATNYVDLGYDNAGTMRDLVTLKAGEVCLFRVKTGLTLRAKANTAAVKLQFLFLEN